MVKHDEASVARRERFVKLKRAQGDAEAEVLEAVEKLFEAKKRSRMEFEMRLELLEIARNGMKRADEALADAIDPDPNDDSVPDGAA